MRRSLHSILILCAWLFASGSHWDVVQTFAWAKMFVSYSQGSSFSVAVQKTFDPDNWCSICETVNDAKRQDQSPAAPGPKVDGKIIFLVPSLTAFQLVVPPAEGWTPGNIGWVEMNRAEPATPPPRWV